MIGDDDCHSLSDDRSHASLSQQRSSSSISSSFVSWSSSISNVPPWEEVKIEDKEYLWREKDSERVLGHEYTHVPRLEGRQSRCEAALRPINTIARTIIRHSGTPDTENLIRNGKEPDTDLVSGTWRRTTLLSGCTFLLYLAFARSL